MQIKKLTVLITLAGAAGAAHATDGYFAQAYGSKAEGMGGASAAIVEDTNGGANNPASMAFVGNRLDVGAMIFSPHRSASRAGSGGLDASVDSDSNYFLIPDFGYNRMLNPNLALGVTVYGNGGMNTNYPGIPAFGNANLLGGAGKLGINLMQLIVAPTLAYKITPDHAIGISPLLGYQKFKAYGLQGFDPGFTAYPGFVTNKGYDDSFGYGVRIGYQGKIAPTLRIGATYAPKMNFDKFSKYKGLFADQGVFDIPENYSLGLAWQATPALNVALDYERINYSDVASVGNPVVPNYVTGFGSSNGPGFGWSDVNVWKLGLEYKHNSQWTFRAGYNHTDNPITGDLTCATLTNCNEVVPNILAPAVVKDHASVGLTYTLASGNELTFAYVHAFENSVKGLDTFICPSGPGTCAGKDTIKMYQDSIGISYGMKM
jgi:long-chain fatty acid transport protein